MAQLGARLGIVRATQGVLMTVAVLSSVLRMAAQDFYEVFVTNSGFAKSQTSRYQDVFSVI
jgi:hypothetical protein